MFPGVFIYFMKNSLAMICLLFLASLSFPGRLMAQVSPETTQVAPEILPQAAEAIGKQMSREEKIEAALKALAQKKKNEPQGSKVSKKVEIIYPRRTSLGRLPGENEKTNVRSAVKPMNIAQDGSSGFEMMVNGKKYSTLKKYKAARLKNLLKESFFQANMDVNAFTDEELMDIIKDIRQNDFLAKNDSLSEMKKMMGLYNKRRDTNEKLSVDFNKVKTIIIRPKGQPRVSD